MSQAARETIAAFWAPYPHQNTTTNRGQVRLGGRPKKDDSQAVDPTWLFRYAESLIFQWRYWDGKTPCYPGKWVSGAEATLSAAKAAAKQLVEDGKARHGCEVNMTCWARSCSGSDWGLRVVWEYGSYGRRPTR